MSKFESDLITLDDVIKKQYFFNIPIYQRLYVWGKEQIHSLLDDIVTAWQEDKNEFYLGGTLVIERTLHDTADTSKLYDLIDGQQRFTTLWLISVVLGEQLTEYRQVQTEQGVRPRINFAIRPQVTEFFEKLCREEKASLPQAKQLEDALQYIKSYFDNAEVKVDKVTLTDFIRTKVQLILTKVPKETDLNKLFEVINNRGVQLQHHEILKAKLLESIDSKKREAYAQLWDACSDMNGYVERHLHDATQVNTLALYESKIEPDVYQREQLSNAKYVIKSLKQNKQHIQTKPMSLAAILKNKNSFTSNDSEPEDELDNGLPDRVSSIITFSMLLQHTLRIYLQKNKKIEHNDISKISDKDLLQIFKLHWLKEQPNSKQVESFFRLLWDVRYQFDKHIIKWVLVEEDKQLAIRRLRVIPGKKNTRYLQRETTDASPSLSLLQSMLYHSQQMTTQYWLTPLLKFLLENNEKNVLHYLQHLDNHLLCSEADAPLIERTHRYLVDCWHTEKVLNAAKSLNQSYDNGTQYPHYWFYKLEYVLYLKLKAKKNNLADNFRMTAKNSVEHVTPQNPRIPQDTIPADLLHTFGNLALVTGSINSEMTDDGFTIKKAKFEERHKGKGVSLKLEDIYSNKQWKKDEIKDHHQKMISDFNLYIKTVNDKTTELLNE
ncbi:DUF262 domain-containing protein [Shewanella frigidimarina]|uniref:DUF262 domain-containing protein n=1 Tax=Shewanella frigidimarina TaxID=56812 RepID=A0A106C2H1_SHEFR|nr:DUF262 domain-containing protein [Shewanella frigidimarina]KVX03030.1 hypothetical protein AWJ07_00165 [Shewanella frigidimarina]